MQINVTLSNLGPGPGPGPVFSLFSQVVEIPQGGAILDTAETVNFYPDLPMETFPNRDSVKYRDVYGIPEVQTIIRGTLRYQVYCTLKRTWR